MDPLADCPPLRSARIAGRTMSWREAGAGAGLPLVLLHGIGANARVWAGQFAGFAFERRVVAWNAPGYVGSDAPAAAWPTPGDYAAACLGWLDHLGIERCVLIGQSLGAVMAAAVVGRAPQRIAALGLASPASGYGVAAGGVLPAAVAARIDDVERFGPVGLADRRAARLLSPAASAGARAIIHRAMAEIVPGGYAQAVRLLAGADLAAAVRAIPVPTMVLWGDADVVTPPAGCQRIAEAAGGAIHVIPGAGHAVATEAPAAFNRAVAALIRMADAASPATERTPAWT